MMDNDITGSQGYLINMVVAIVLNALLVMKIIFTVKFYLNKLLKSEHLKEENVSAMIAKTFTKIKSITMDESNSKQKSSEEIVADKRKEEPVMKEISDKINEAIENF